MDLSSSSSSIMAMFDLTPYVTVFFKIIKVSDEIEKIKR